MRFIEHIANPLPIILHTFLISVQCSLLNDCFVIIRLIFHHIIHKESFVICLDGVVDDLAGADGVLRFQRFQIIQYGKVNAVNVRAALEESCADALVGKVKATVLALHEAVVHVVDKMGKVDLCPFLAEQCGKVFSAPAGTGYRKVFSGSGDKRLVDSLSRFPQESRAHFVKIVRTIRFDQFQLVLLDGFHAVALAVNVRKILPVHHQQTLYQQREVEGVV